LGKTDALAGASSFANSTIDKLKTFLTSEESDSAVGFAIIGLGVILLSSIISKIDVIRDLLYKLTGLLGIDSLDRLADIIEGINQLGVSLPDWVAKLCDKVQGFIGLWNLLMKNLGSR